MNKTYVAVMFGDVKEEDADMLIAMLSEIGFDGFEEAADVLKAYVGKDDWDENSIVEIARLFALSYQCEDVPVQNWNAVWESNFEPVVIDDFVAVRAHFHNAIDNVQHEIVITPKMSFGTGHHATTTMMIEQMRNLDFVGKTVLDFGTGTGILSILAEKLGATDIVAIDNDEWSIENGKENIERNSCSHVMLALRNDADVNRLFDVILANINRNVILENFSFLYSQLHTGSYLLLSGLLAEDEQMIHAEAVRYQLSHLHTQYKLPWISLLYTR